MTVNYEVLAGASNSFGLESPLSRVGFTHVIVDESWRVARGRSATSVAVRRLCKHVGRAQLLNGTPVNNGPSDLWAQLDAVCPRGIIPGKPKEFTERFSILTNTQVRTRNGNINVAKETGCSDPAGLVRLMEPYYFRATKSACTDLAAKLPAERLEFPLSEEQRLWYDAVRQRGVLALGDSLSLADARVAMLRLQQISGGHVVTTDRGQVDLPLPADFAELPDEIDIDPSFRTWELPCPKFDWLVQWLTERLADPTARVGVWCKFNAEVDRIGRVMSEILGEHRVQVAKSGVSEERLERSIASFNSRSPNGVGLIVAQIKKLGYSRNLQGGDVAVFYSNPWSRVERVQAEDRFHRLGRVGMVRYIQPVTGKGLIDDYVIDTLTRKGSVAERLEVETFFRS